MPDQTTVTIGLRDVYDAVQGLRTDVTRIGEAIKPIGDHETRLRSLERWKYMFPASLVVSAGSAAVAIIVNHR